MKNNTMRLAAEAMIPALILIAACMFKAMSLWAVDASPVRVYPNPWRSDLYLSRSVTLDSLPHNCTVKIFTVSGDHVKTLAAPSSTVSWDLTNENGDHVISGVYMYVAKTAENQTYRGKIAVIR